MSVFLTQNSPGLRTSPVKRAIGLFSASSEIVPPPPPVVPELPNDESKSDLPVRDMLAKHRENPAVRRMPRPLRFFGLAFEGCMARSGCSHSRSCRTRRGHSSHLPGRFAGQRTRGLRSYIREHRQQGLVSNLCRKLLAYSLNRSLQLSDEALIDTMATQLAAKEYRFASLVETIVTSPQFLNKRVLETPQSTPP